MNSLIEVAESGVEESADRSRCLVENQTWNTTRTYCVPACDCLDWNVVSSESVLKTLSVIILNCTFTSIYREVIVHMLSSANLLPL